MNKVFAILLTLVAVSLWADVPKTEGVGEVKTLRVLLIGNSWSWSLNRYFRQVVASNGDCKVELGFAVIGGCSLERHWKEYEKSLADPSYKPYQEALNPRPYAKQYSLVDKLEMEKWDIVTLNQASEFSWAYEEYQPYANELIAVIHKHAPTAEVVVQQTWSHNVFSDIFKIRGFDQTGMYEKAADAYDKLASECHLRLIPMGYAVQLFRQGKEMPMWDFDAIEKLGPENPVPDYPDVVGMFMWYKQGDAPAFFYKDPVHLNRRGEYFQACVWYAALFGKNPEECKFIPPEIDPQVARELQTVAKNAVEEYRQKGKL